MKNKQVKQMICCVIEDTVWICSEWCDIKLDMEIKSTPHSYSYYPKEDVGIVSIKANEIK